MKTAYYTFTVWEDNAMAAGFDGGAASRQAMLVRQPEEQARRTGGDNVIDLNAWRADDEAERWAEAQDGPGWAGEELDEPEPAAPAPRPRRDHRRAMLIAELVSTVCVAAVAAALILRILAF